MIITIDGPVATGKSTIAKKLAYELGYIYFDTGAMYRSVAYGLLKAQVDLDDLVAVQAYLNHFNFDIKIKQGLRHYYVDGEDITEVIRGPEVTSIVSKVSAIESVRNKLVALIRTFAEGVNAVFEGRDMGSLVFPHAEIKIFLTGNAEIRAERRYKELKEKYPEVYKDQTLEKTKEEIIKRDHFDSTRKFSPLIQATDAYVVDTSYLTPEEIVIKILEYKDTKPYLVNKKT